MRMVFHHNPSLGVIRMNMITDRIVPLLVVVAIVALGCSPSSPPKPTETSEPPPQGANKLSGDEARSGGMPLDPTAVAAALMTDFSSLFHQFNPALNGVTDATTAQAALPELQKMSDQIDVLNAALQKVTAPLQPAVIRSIEEPAATFRKQADKVLAIPGVAAVLKETIDGILNKLPAPERGQSSAS
jgi:hypothetical protein